MKANAILLAHAPRRESCPHCRARGVQRWGHFSGRQRYRCTACRHTFSTFTGTALHYLKRIDAWAGFVVAMQHSLTLREAARANGIHRDTAFRWRHRFLAAVERGDSVVLQGEVAIGSTWFRHSRKGQKQAYGRADCSVTADPMAIGSVGRPGGRVWAVLAKDARGLSISSVVGDVAPGARALSDSVRDRVAPGTRIRSHRGPYSSEAACARRLGLRFGRHSPASSDEEPEPVRAWAVRIKRWIRRFNGIATRYLSHYLSWFQIMDSGWSSKGWDLGLLGMTASDPAASQHP